MLRLSVSFLLVRTFCLVSFVRLFSLRPMVLRKPVWSRCRGQSSVSLESFKKFWVQVKLPFRIFRSSIFTVWVRYVSNFVLCYLNVFLIDLVCCTIQF